MNDPSFAFYDGAERLDPEAFLRKVGFIYDSDTSPIFSQPDTDFSLSHFDRIIPSINGLGTTRLPCCRFARCDLTNEAGKSVTVVARLINCYYGGNWNIYNQTAVLVARTVNGRSESELLGFAVFVYWNVVGENKLDVLLFIQRTGASDFESEVTLTLRMDFPRRVTVKATHATLQVSAAQTDGFFFGGNNGVAVTNGVLEQCLNVWNYQYFTCRAEHEGKDTVTVYSGGIQVAQGTPYAINEQFNIGSPVVAVGDYEEPVDQEAEILKKSYPPIFADLRTTSRRPLFADLRLTSRLPLYAMPVASNFISYWFEDKSHLWTRICPYKSTASFVPDYVFPGRVSDYDGSSSSVANDIKVDFVRLANLPNAVKNDDGTVSVTLYFYCALCNWGCTSEYESGTVSFKILWKSFWVTGIRRSTAKDPGPGSEPFAFEFTVTLKPLYASYTPTDVIILDKNGDTH